MVCAGGAQTYFSPMLPTCVHFRKSEHFSSLKRKVREDKAPTATLLCCCNNVSKTAVDLKKNAVGDWKLERAIFRRAFSEEKRSFGIVIARVSNDNDMNHTLRWWFVEVLLMSLVSCEKRFLSPKKRNVSVFKYARIDRMLHFIANLYTFWHRHILRLVKLGHSKRDWE